MKILLILLNILSITFASTVPTIDDIEKYLNSLKTIEVNFIQNDITNDVISVGNFYMSRPDKLRIDYIKPNRIKIYVNGGVIIYYDEDLDEITNIPIATTPIDFLLRKNISLNDKNIVTEKIIDNKKEIVLTLKEKNKEDNRTLTIIFNKNPISLKKINFKNELGQIIEMNIVNIKINENINNPMFNFISPRLKRKI